MEYKGIIIIPDVHGRRFWKPAVQKFASELTSDEMHCVFLGDYLDPYEFEQQQELVGSSTDVINNFKEILKIKEALGSSMTLLLGNHDLHYIDEYEPFSYRCRYMYDKEATIKRLFYDNWDNFSLAFETTFSSGKRCLITHAGVLKGWVDSRFDNMSDSSVIKADWLNSFLHGPNKEKLYIFNDCGEERGGRGYGSPVWADALEFYWGFMNERHRNESPELRQVVYPDIYQIFGHSLAYPFAAEELFGEYSVTEDFAMLDCRKAFLLEPDGKISEIS